MRSQAMGPGIPSTGHRAPRSGCRGRPRLRTPGRTGPRRTRRGTSAPLRAPAAGVWTVGPPVVTGSRPPPRRASSAAGRPSFRPQRQRPWPPPWTRQPSWAGSGPGRGNTRGAHGARREPLGAGQGRGAQRAGTGRRAVPVRRGRVPDAASRPRAPGAQPGRVDGARTAHPAGVSAPAVADEHPAGTRLPGRTRRRASQDRRAPGDSGYGDSGYGYSGTRRRRAGREGSREPGGRCRAVRAPHRRAPRCVFARPYPAVHLRERR